MATQRNTGSGIDQPNKPNLTSRIIDKITQSGSKPVEEKDEAPNDAQRDAQRDAKARRIEQERSAFDLKHKPTERDAQIDGSGARFEVDG
jgi:hypothetical protein